MSTAASVTIALRDNTCRRAPSCRAGITFPAMGRVRLLIFWCVRGKHRSVTALEKVGAWLLVAALLAGCAAQEEKKVEENIYPQGYRTEILEYLHKELPDPSGIRDAFVSEPTLTNVGGTQRYVACLRFDPKERPNKPGELPKYSGIREMAIYYYAGKMTQMVKAPPELCAKAAYQPFPELTKLCREAVCKQT
jgi:hypothetical protein